MDRNMSILKTCLIVLLFYGVGLCAETLLRAEVQGAALVAINGDGNTIVVTEQGGQVVVFKRIAATHHRIEIKDFGISMSQPPVLTDDGKYMYFMDSGTGYVTKASLINTNVANQQIEVMN